MDEGNLGEFEVIERLRAMLAPAANPRLVVGIGDDAAAWRSDDGITLATTDTLVAGVHFIPGTIPWRLLGWKALAANISDIAAMGGKPTFALVTLALPPDADIEDLEEMYAGMQEIADVYGVTIAGGDIVKSPVFSVTVALSGDATVIDAAPELLRRDAARAGDAIGVTAPLGGSAGGLRVLLDYVGELQEGGDAEMPEGADVDDLLEMHMRPWPRVDAGDIALRAGIRCAIDISDGLAQDLGHICRASGVDAEIELATVPVDEHVLARFPEQALQMAVTGGEDYELVLVGSDGALARADRLLRDHLEMPDTPQVVIIGRITGAGSGRVRLLDAGGAEVRFESAGWDHLRGDGGA